MSYDNDRPFSSPRRDQFANRLRVDRLRATLHVSDIEEVRRLRFRGNLVILQLVERRYSTYKRLIIPFN